MGLPPTGRRASQCAAGDPGHPDESVFPWSSACGEVVL